MKSGPGSQSFFFKFNFIFLLLLKRAEAHLDLSQSSNGHLRRQDDRLGVSPSDLKHHK